MTKNRIRAATARGHPNIALIKYWGNRDHDQRIPSNGSISLTLGRLETRTTVQFDPGLGSDQASIDGRLVRTTTMERISEHLDRVRVLAGVETHAQVISENNFPQSAGIASSASGFAVLTMAACGALGLDLPPEELSRLARKGSGSAARSVFGGYVELKTGQTDLQSYARQLYAPEHWNLFDLIAVISTEEKPISSSKGHRLAETSPLQAARIEDAPRRLRRCRNAIRDRDFSDLASIVEQDSDLMHAVMQTSSPPILYWLPGTVGVMRRVRELREEGLEVCYTVDAGPNVHCLCPAEAEAEVEHQLADLPYVQEIIKATPGGPIRLEE